MLSQMVARKLRLNWSPEQIAGWLKRTYPGNEHNQVSHETIYRSLFVQARGVLKKELLKCLRSKRTIRRSRHASLKRDDGAGQIRKVARYQFYVFKPSNVEQCFTFMHQWNFCTADHDSTGSSINLVLPSPNRIINSTQDFAAFDPATYCNAGTGSLAKPG